MNVRLTRSEKEDVRLVAAFDRKTDSELFRDIMSPIRERAAAIRAGTAVAA